MQNKLPQAQPQPERFGRRGPSLAGTLAGTLPACVGTAFGHAVEQGEREALRRAGR